MDLRTFEKPQIGRKSEIRAFGCMLTDVATWMSFGPFVREFTRSREFEARPAVFLGLFHRGIGKKKSAVDTWIQKLLLEAPQP